MPSVHGFSTGGVSRPGGSTTFSVNAPTNSDGDLIVFIADQDYTDSATDMSPPAGVTFYSSKQSSSKTWIWTKIASGEPASYTFTINAADACSVVILAISNSSNTIAADGGWLTPTSGTSVAAPSVTTPSNSCLVVAVYSAFQGGSQSWTLPGGMTADGGSVINSNTSGQNSNFVTMAVGHYTQASAGATGTKTATIGGGGSATGIQLALAPPGTATSWLLRA